MKTFLIITVSLIIVGIIAVLMRIPTTTNSTKDSNNNDLRIERVDSTQFKSEIEKDNVVILDIRTPGEFNTGYIANAKNIDYYSPNFSDQLNELDKDLEYKIYCNSGNRSAQALQMMKSLGFKNVVDLKGGITAWRGASLDICTNC